MSNFENQPEDILENDATLTGEALIEPCVNCNEVIHFVMQDNYHKFSIGLKVILDCLKFAEEQGEIPKLPVEWWQRVINKFR